MSFDSLFDDADQTNEFVDLATEAAQQALNAEHAQREAAKVTARLLEMATRAAEAAQPSEPAAKLTKTAAASVVDAKGKKRGGKAATSATSTETMHTMPDGRQIRLPPALKVHTALAGGKSKGDRLSMFCATYHDAEELGLALASLRGVMEEYELHFDRRTGLTISGMNVSHTIFTNVHVPAEAFVQFNLASESVVLPTTARFSIRAEALYALRGEFLAGYTLTFCTLLGTKAGVHEEVNLQLHPALSNNGKAPDALFSIPQIDAEHEMFGSMQPWTIYQFRVTMRTVHLKALMLQLKRYGDTAFRLSNRGLDVMGFDGDSKSASRKCINYTATTRRDSVLSGFDVFRSCRTDTENDAGRRELPASELDMFDALKAEGPTVALCHLDRLRRRQTTCTHMDCVVGPPDIDPATGKPACDIFGEEVPGRPTCERLAGDGTAENGTLDTGIVCTQDENVVTRMSTIDRIRFHTKFLTDALTTLLDTEYVELFFGRQDPPNDDMFYPLLMRGRTLDGNGRLVMIERLVYIIQAENEK